MIEIPEELGDLNDDQLRDIATQIEAAADEYRGSGLENLSDEELAEVERLSVGYQRISDELTEREQATADRQARASDALSRIGGGSDEQEDGGDTVETAVASSETFSEEDNEADVEADETSDETSDEASEESDADTDEGDTESESEPEADAEGEDDEAEAEADEVTDEESNSEEPEAPAEGDDEGDPDADTGADETVSDTEELNVEDDITTATDSAVERLSNARPGSAAPEETEADGRVLVMARATENATGLGVDRGEELNLADLSRLVVQKHRQMSRLGGAPHEPIVLASARTLFDDDQMLGTSAEDNYAVIEGIKRKATALVASGGNCAPLAPSYDIFRLAEPMSPVENCLPVVGAPRGGIRFIVPPAFTDVAGGVRITTEAQDRAGYPPTAPKPCVSVECPDVEECQVDMISRCITFGNLQFRTFPEWVESRLQDLSVIFAQTKENFYLDAIDAGSTAVNATPPYGATRGTNFSLAQASHAYRKRNHMPLGSVIDVLAPDSLVPFLAADMVNDHALGLSFLNADAEMVANELFRKHRLNVCWYYDGDNSMQGAQAAGPLNPWPTTFELFMYSPGTWVRLDEGVLDLGIVRDSTLNSTNDLQIFAEQFIQVCKVGIESIKLTLTLCPSGGAPEPEELLICAS